MTDRAAIPKVEVQNALATRIALLLNFLSRKSYLGLVAAGRRRPLSSEKELLRLMVSGNYIDPARLEDLKSACRNFAGTQEDIRFGALAVSFGFVARGRLDRVLEAQRRLEQSGEKVFIGDLFVAAGVLSDRQKKLILHKQKMEQERRRSVAGLGTDVKIFREKGFTLYVTPDELGAYAVKTPRFHDRVGLAGLKRVLLDIGIIYGTVSREKLLHFLKAVPAGAAPFEIARGRKPLPPRDARITYNFSREYLSAGSLLADGAIDFRDRGEIPLVKKNAVVAEKIPIRQGRDGISVFGNTITARPPRDLTVRCGEGVVLSGDRRRAYAARDGFPDLNRNGMLSVSDVHFVRGDVDYTTGHIRFEKSVVVTGRIKAGFKVEAHNVTAGAVDGGEITARGDVVVTHGVIDAAIKAAGDFNAGFVHRSAVTCLGNAAVEKEIVESTLSAGGGLDMSKGTLLASTVSAGGGACFRHVGSVKTKPSKIVVGASPVNPPGRQGAGTIEQPERTPLKPELKVSGRILPGTRVNGEHSTLVLSRKRVRVRIRERHRSGNRIFGRTGWEMVTSPF